MPKVVCPHCQHVNDIFGAKPGQPVECIKCDARFAIRAAEPRWSEPPVATPASPANSDDLRRAVDTAKRIADGLDAANRRLKNLAQVAGFFAAFMFVLPLVTMGFVIAGGGRFDQAVAMMIVLPWLIACGLASVIAVFIR